VRDAEAAAGGDDREELARAHITKEARPVRAVTHPNLRVACTQCRTQCRTLIDTKKAICLIIIDIQLFYS
jgi:hypothetical protein